MRPWKEALLLTSLLWAVCFVACLGLAGIAVASKPDEVTEGGIEVTDFGAAFFLVFTTFHSNTWGHTIPNSAGQRFASSVAALLGYLFTPAAFATCLKAAGAQKQLMGSIVSFFVVYCACFIIAVLVHAIAYNSNSVDGFEMSLYYAWMTFHNRCYGELYPVGTAQEFLAALSSVLSLMPALTAALTALAFTSTDTSAMAHPTPKALAKAVGEIQVCVGNAEVSLDCDLDREKVMTMLGIPDLDVAPPGMVTISLKDRVAGDSAEGMVAALYEALPNGAQHQKRMQVPAQADGWLVYVPSEDVAALQEMWQSHMQEARKSVEKGFKAEGKKRRAPRLRFHIQESSSSSSNHSCAGSSDEFHSQSSCSIGMASDPTSASESSSSKPDKASDHTSASESSSSKLDKDKPYTSNICFL